MKIFTNAVRYALSIHARHAGVQLGKDTRVSPKGKWLIHPSSRITFSDNVQLASNFMIIAGQNSEVIICKNARLDEGIRIEVGTGASVYIGDSCFVGHHSSIVSLNKVRVGDDTLLGPYTYLSDHNHGLAKETLIRVQDCVSEPLTVGCDVWLGIGATLLKGSKIGDGAVIAARAVVNKSVPPYEIWAGVPAKRIGERL